MEPPASRVWCKSRFVRGSGAGMQCACEVLVLMPNAWIVIREEYTDTQLHTQRPTPSVYYRGYPILKRSYPSCALSCSHGCARLITHNSSLLRFLLLRSSHCPIDSHHERDVTCHGRAFLFTWCLLFRELTLHPIGFYLIKAMPLQGVPESFSCPGAMGSR